MKKLMLIFMLCFLGLSIAETPIYATNHQLFITEIKLGGAVVGQPTEFVELFNDSDVVVDLAGIKLEYAKAASSILETQCMLGPWDDLDASSNVKTFDLTGLIQPRGRVVFETSLNDNVHGSIRLAQYSTNDELVVIHDLVGWGEMAKCKETEPASLPPNGKSIKRLFNADGHPIDTNNNKNDFSLSQSPLPEDDSVPETEEPEPVESLCHNSVVISEFLTDPDGLEADGGEFIELYNPGSTEVSLLGCELKSSKSTSSLITFSAIDKIPAGGYFLVNLADKLTNTNGSITFISLERDEVINYASLKEGETFALISGQWQVTDKATPGDANQLVLLAEEEVATDGISALAPCPEGKYRSLETNRCRNIELAASDLSPCDVGETRNPETNRCRKITLAAASLATCDEGEERNLATNRCRKIATASTDLKPCEDGYERNQETNRCRKIASVMGASNSLATADEAVGGSKVDIRIILVVLALATGYGIYEYRTDIKNLFERIIARFAKTGPPG